jgi:hypothetical protein
LTKTSGRQGDITSIVTVDDRLRRREHFDIRYDVFVDEQGIFTDTDEDTRDSDPSTIHLIGLINGRTVGAVRLYPLDVGCNGRGIGLRFSRRTALLDLVLNLCKRRLLKRQLMVGWSCTRISNCPMFDSSSI